MHRIFLDAGLDAPQGLTDALTGGSPAFIEEFTAYVAETVRSLLPLLIQGGIATAEEVDIDTLAARCRDEALGHGSVIRSFLFMGAWAPKAQPRPPDDGRGRGI
jgi:hypothetical protein